MRWTTVPAILVAIGLALATAGCGGSAAATPNPTILGADFATSALAACDAAVVMKQAEGPFPFPDFNPTKPDVAKLGQVADYLEKTATTYEAWSGAMKGARPTGGRRFVVVGARGRDRSPWRARARTRSMPPGRATPPGSAATTRWASRPGPT